MIVVFRLRLLVFGWMRLGTLPRSRLIGVRLLRMVRVVIFMSLLRRRLVLHLIGSRLSLNSLLTLLIWNVPLLLVVLLKLVGVALCRKSSTNKTKWRHLSRTSLFTLLDGVVLFRLVTLSRLVVFRLIRMLVLLLLLVLVVVTFTVLIVRLS